MDRVVRLVRLKPLLSEIDGGKPPYKALIHNKMVGPEGLEPPTKRL